MTLILIEFAIVLAGFAAAAVLFYRLPKLPAADKLPTAFPSVSVIIPARNEEKNLPLLLADLSTQTLPIREMICVDDDSEDSTAQIAEAGGARVIRLATKPEGWTGKTWACQNGADAAAGELLLFLDADVRLSPEGIRILLCAYLREGCTISVQPYHKTERVYEQLSMMFNLVQIAANGIALPKPRNVGLYGPVILISRQAYNAAGGHERVKTSVVEDMALASRLKSAGLPFRLFIGNQAVSFRMYGGGLRSLLEGWVKNLATGASGTPVAVFIMVFLWITSLISVPLQLVKFTVVMNLPWQIVYGFLYLVWICLMAVFTRRIGRFQAWAVIFYPVPVLVLLGVLLVSVFKKLFGLKVIWKGRAIETGGKACD